MHEPVPFLGRAPPGVGATPVTLPFVPVQQTPIVSQTDHLVDGLTDRIPV